MSTVGRIAFGGDYFPEQWPRETWEQDVRLMKQANVNLVSIAIFAWALLEPTEGTFTFGWLDEIMDLLAANGIDVCLGTATAAQPNWLTRGQDDVLFVRESGQRVAPGSRQTYCINSPAYRSAARRLVEQLALHFRAHPALALWHVNNEYGNKNSMCFCQNCEHGFQEWLKSRYASIENLNEGWGTVFWSERYSNWQEINAPRASAGGRNATKLLDYKRFLSDSFLGLYVEEWRVLKRITPNVPITTNFEGDWSKFDHSLFRDHLDVVSFNGYPNPCDRGARQWAALRYSMMRSLLAKPFLLMEQAPSQVDWYPINRAKRPGLMRLWSYQAIAHGSDSAMFFQWRASKKGAEKYHSGIVSHYGEGSRVFREVSDLGTELARAKDVVGSGVRAEVAILLDIDSWWAIDNPYGSGGKSLDNETFWAANAQPFPTVLASYFRELEHYFAAFYGLNVAVDVVPSNAVLSRYRVVIAPLLHVVKPALAQALKEFVRDGGTFVATYLSGFADETLGVFPGGYPGPLKDLLGIQVEEYDPLPLDGANTIRLEVPLSGFEPEYGCRVWCDVAHTTSARALATFGEDYYAGSPCFTENAFGAGKAYYLATRPDDAFMRAFARKLLAEQSIQATELPDGVELVTRSGQHGAFHFYLNHTERETEIRLPDGRYEDLLTNAIHGGSLRLARYAVHILTKLGAPGGHDAHE
jgi:beta-galactosidase